MCSPRLFLKLNKTEYNLLNVAKKESNSSSYRELIMTLFNGEYIDYLCNSILSERALRRILVNLNQLKPGYSGEGDISGFIKEIESITFDLVTWNNAQIKPLFSHKEATREIQVRLSLDEKTLITSAKKATSFPTYGDLVMRLCYSFLSGNFSFPPPVDFTLFDKLGIEINNNTREYNTYKIINYNSLNKTLNNLYQLIQDLTQNLSLLRGMNVSKY